MNAVEIFGGAGGLALGVSQAGFKHLALIEVDHFACETLRDNKRRGHKLAKVWPLYQEDVKQYDYSIIEGEVDLLTAGLPCQPFSFAGKSKAHHDKRDMFSEVVRAARELRPKAILIENVKGLVRPGFKDYFDYLLLAIASPGLMPEPNESWQAHFDSLRNTTAADDLKYRVHVHTVNAADYGAPQWRDRVLIVAFRSDLPVKWTLPSATYSVNSLLWDQIRNGSYWKRHGLHRKRSGKMSRRFANHAKSIPGLARRPPLKPWRTVRDALRGLPQLRQGQTSTEVHNHFLNCGARPYNGHTGSLMDEPAKTLKAGSHGVPGGENSLSIGRGRIRYFSVRECARLQTFPDDYVFTGPWIHAMRQVGNAVPVVLARVMAAGIKKHLNAVAKAKSATRAKTPVLQFPQKSLSPKRPRHRNAS